MKAPVNAARRERSYIGNLTFDQAQQINGDVGRKDPKRGERLIIGTI